MANPPWVEYTLDYEVRTARQVELRTGAQWQRSTIATGGSDDLGWMRKQRDAINCVNSDNIRNARIVRKVCEVHQ